MNATSTNFLTTRWTLVRHATGHSVEGQQALSELCAACYEPVVTFLRQSGRDEDTAREVAHGFFEAILAKPALGGAEPGRGRFRSYLLGALKHYLSNLRARDARQKRGGGVEIVTLDAGTDTSPGIDPGDQQALSPDREFDRQWALHVLRRASAALAAEWAAAGRADEFALLQPFIAGDPEHGDIASLAEQQAQSSATLRKTLSRLRQAFRQKVKAEITPTLGAGNDANDEMQELLLALTP